MRILSISLNNIKSHRQIELMFVKGINVLSGPNGVGKSTIFEAIGYAMFGVDARDFVGNIDRFISIGAKKGNVAVIFSADDQKTYRVSRTVGPGAKWLLAKKIAEKFEVEDHAGIPETEARMKEILGLDNGRSLADQFKLVIGPFQNEFLGPFVLKQPTKRQEAFDEILGIDAWRKTYKGTKTLMTSIKSKIDIIHAEIEGKNEQVASLDDRQKELQVIIEESKACQNKLSQGEKIFKEKEKQLVKFDKLEKTLHNLKTKIQVLESRIVDGKGKVKEQEKRVKEAQNAHEIMAKHLEGKNAFSKAEETIKVLRNQEKERRIIEKEINTLTKESDRLEQKYTHEKKEIVANEKEVEAEKKKLTQKSKEFVPSRQVIKAAERLPEFKKELEGLGSALGLLAGKRVGLEEGRDKLDKGVCPYFTEQCQNIVGKSPKDVFTYKLNSIEKDQFDFQKQVASLNAKIAEAEKAQQEIDSLKVRQDEASKQLKLLEKKNVQNSERKQKLEELARKAKEAHQKVLTEKKTLGQFKGLDEEISRAEKARKTHQKARDIFVTNQKIADDLKKRQESLKQMVELLNDLNTNSTLQTKDLNALNREYDTKLHNGVRSAKETLGIEIATFRQKLQAFEKDQARLKKEIKAMKQVQKEIKVKLKEKKKNEQKAELIKFLRSKVFNHVSTHLSERFREEISQRADRIYRNISETDEELYWADKYQIVLRDMADGQIRERSDDQLSGGQIMSAVVSLRLALLQTIGARIAFFDEPTSNLDASRRENLASAFRKIDVGREELTEHWYDQLFLISHDVAFTEVTDQIISLDKDAN